MKEFGSIYQVLRQIEDRKIFKLQIAELSPGHEHRPLSDVLFEKVTLEKPMQVVRITELCDEYYQVDLTVEDLLLIAEGFKHMANSLQTMKEEAHRERFLSKRTHECCK